MRRLLVSLALELLANPSWGGPPDPDPALLGFERLPLLGMPGWYGSPPDTVFSDAGQKHSGARALRLERIATSDNIFSFVALNIPIDFAGEQIELRGWMRQDGEGAPSLWMRQDGAGKPLGFIDMGRTPRISADWSQYSIAFRRLPAARTLVVGVRLDGVGKAWADDLELFIDGKPWTERTRAEHVATVLEKDTQFDGGSGLTVDALTRQQIDTLMLTGKVWGFLKYHHPAVTGGKYHWDYELLRRLPALLGAPDTAATQKILADWVDSLGPVADCQPCVQAGAGGQLAPGPGWLSDERLLGTTLATRLQAIYRNRVPDRQFFVALEEGVGNPAFDTELPYPALRFPDSGFQVVAIYRFWNVIEYWFPYRDLIDENWDAVLRDTLEHAARGLDAESFQRELMAMVARADDGHANLWSSVRLREPAGECQLPVTLRYVESRFVVGAVAGDAAAKSFRVGDVVESLDGERAEDMVKRVRRYYGASNEPARMRDLARALTRGACGSVKVALQRKEPVTIEAQRVRIEPKELNALYVHDRPGDTFQMLSPDLAYLKLSSIKVADVPGYMEKARNAKSLVVDLRNYPSEFVVYALGQLLVDEYTRFARFSTPALSAPGAFGMGDAVGLEPAQPHFAGRVAILVDETTQSQAEYTAMALRASPRAIVVGSQTAGADGNISQLTFPGGFRAAFSGIGVFYPDKKPTQQVGVAIDVPCKATIAGIRAGRDEILDCALKTLRKTH